jgi:hypothetical protein
MAHSLPQHQKGGIPCVSIEPAAFALELCDRFCCTVNALLLHGLTMRTRALPVAQAEEHRRLEICGDLHSKASSVVLPVPAPPIKNRQP